MADSLFEYVDRIAEEEKLPKGIIHTIHTFLKSYLSALEDAKHQKDSLVPLLKGYVEAISAQNKNPYLFPPYHEKRRVPYDYYHFGMEFLRPLVDFSRSTFTGIDQLEIIRRQIELGDNVILFANHQIEADPQAISLLIEKGFPEIAEEMIFVAGHRVTTDPIAVPFSLGRNLLCIYSRNYIENPPEEKQTKVQHNRRTMKRMGELLNEGGACIYVAPSGGRDRPDDNGVVQLAPFDPQSIEMFRIVANHATRPTHFYPMALSTYHILPPPLARKSELGEERIARFGPIHLAIGEEIPMDELVNENGHDKHQVREMRAEKIEGLVKNLYDQFSK